MIKLDTAIPSEPLLNDGQKLLLKTTRDFINMEKLDLKQHQFRCYLGHGSFPEVVIRELADVNTHFWPVVPNPRIAERLGMARYLYPHSSEEVWNQLKDSVVCLTSATEYYGGAFLRRLEGANIKAIFHWGG